MVERSYITVDIPPEEIDPVQEECGVVAIYRDDPHMMDQNIQLALRAATGVQHRGQQGVGIAGIKSNGRDILHRENGLLRQVFNDRPLAFKEGEDPFTLSDEVNPVLVQCRYGTDGGYGDYNLQPCVAGDKVYVAHNGNFVVTERMRTFVGSFGSELPVDASDTLIFTHFVAHQKGETWDDRILQACEKASGAYSLAMIAGDSVYLSRDQQGLRPMVLGRLGERGWIATSETHALDKIGVPVLRELKRGEIVRINKDGLTILKEGLDGAGHFCDFELAYFAFPTSTQPIYDQKDDGIHPERWFSVYEFRNRCGQTLTKEAPHKLDVMIGIPDSGVPLGIGYSRASRVPYEQSIIRDHYDPDGDQRLFQGDNKMAEIKGKVLGKLSVVANLDYWKGKIVGLADDSFVRGTVSRALTNLLKSLGVKEVHWFVGFPPVMHPCHLGVSMRTYEELIAVTHKGKPEDIAHDIGATSVNYISPEGFIRAKRGSRLIIPKRRDTIYLYNGGCGGCLTGVYPVSKEGVVYEFK